MPSHAPPCLSAILASAQKRIARFLPERLQACVRSLTLSTPVTSANVMPVHIHVREQEMLATSQRSCLESESRGCGSGLW